MSAATLADEMTRLRDQMIAADCADCRDALTAAWCAAALRLYGRLGLRQSIQEAYERRDWPEHRRRVAVLMRAEGETS